MGLSGVSGVSDPNKEIMEGVSGVSDPNEESNGQELREFFSRSVIVQAPPPLLP
jgi:hypothetical protein